MYKSRDFNIDFSHGDNKFNLNYLINHMSTARLNICSKGQYIPIVERSIQTIKQGARCTTHSVPYKRYMKLIIRSLLECITHSRNSFPHKGSISKKLGPSIMLLGKTSPYFNMKGTLFGFYAMVYKGSVELFQSKMGKFT